MMNPGYSQVPPPPTAVLPPSAQGLAPKPTLTRPVKAFEKGSTWLVLCGALAFLIFIIIAFFAFGPLSKVDDLRFGPNLRGYTFGGLLMGFGAVLCVCLAGWYSVRKRRNVTGSSMMTWLWAHVWLGLLGFFAATMHAGSGIISFSFTSGKVLYFFFFVIVFTGVLWRLAYARIPKEAAVKVLNYSEAGAKDRAEQLELEIAKLTAGKSPALGQLKDLLLQREVPPQEVQHFAMQIPPEEHPLIDELLQLAASRQRALARPPMQKRFTAQLQAWRKWHVPITVFFFLMLFVHMFCAIDLHRKMLPVGVAMDGPLAAFRPSSDCRECHTQIYDSWADSMHAHALISPLTVVQNNLDMHHGLGTLPDPEPRRMCINCHGPAVAAMSSSDNLPLVGERQKEGVECVSCHQLTEAVTPGGGGLTTVYNVKLKRGDIYFSRLDNPVGNAYHRSQRNDMFDKPETLCATCHMVNLDKNGDGKIVKGTDLVLQTTLDEYRYYQQRGGKQTCVDCHMPLIPNVVDVAPGATPPFTEDYPPAARPVHDHSFVGVDYPLDEVSKRDPQKAKRAAMLKSAATLSVVSSVVVGNDLDVKIGLDNLTGHNLPTGFAFARQMWIEFEVTDNGVPIFNSGALKKNTDDLCDNGTFGDVRNPLRSFVIGCAEVDKQLVNIQLKLVDLITTTDQTGQSKTDDYGQPVLFESLSGKGETYLQEPGAGGVARKRPSDNSSLAPLLPFEHREYQYVVPLEGLRAQTGSFKARLLFRNLPPYWLRGMANEEPKNEIPQLGPLIQNLQIVEMGVVTGNFATAGHVAKPGDIAVPIPTAVPTVVKPVPPKPPTPPKPKPKGKQ